MNKYHTQLTNINIRNNHIQIAEVLHLLVTASIQQTQRLHRADHRLFELKQPQQVVRDGGFDPGDGQRGLAVQLGEYGQGS